MLSVCTSERGIDFWKNFGKKWFLRVVCPLSSFNISQNDITALEHAYTPKNRLYASFLTLNKMTIKFFQISKFSNNLGIRSESSQCEISLCSYRSPPIDSSKLELNSSKFELIPTCWFFILTNCALVWNPFYKWRVIASGLIQCPSP